MADISVIQNIKKAAAATGADPVALLATSLVETGARPGIVGDQGTSFGPFQFHQGGALGTHTPAWADSYAAYLNRAQAFAAGQVHHGKGAAAIQRPADPTGYATKVDANAREARRLLGIGAPSSSLPGKAPAPAAPAAELADPTGDALLSQLASSQPGGVGATSGIQNLLNANARAVGIQAPTFLPPAVPQAPGGVAQTVERRSPTPKVAGSRPAAPVAAGRVIPGKPHIIGTPYAGTHTLGNWQSDNAVDIAMPVGTPIRAPYSGVIGSRIGSLGSSSPRFAGLRLTLQSPGQQLYMAHLSRLAVKAGQQVKAGQILGYSGEANGVAHLHLGALKGNPGRYA